MATTKGTAKSVFWLLTNVINGLSDKFRQDPMLVLGTLFTLELIKSRFSQYPLWSVFEDEKRFSRKYIQQKYVERKNEMYLKVNADELVDFIACRRDFDKYEDEKKFVVKTLEDYNLGHYDKQKNVFYYTGYDDLIKVMKNIVERNERKT